MRFHENVVVYWGLVQFTSAGAGSTIFNACDAEVVMQSSQEGFLQYVLLNCVPDYDTPTLNLLGDDIVNLADCLTNWIADHQTGNPIPESGDCRTAYQNLLDQSSSDWSEYFKANCEIVDGQVDITDKCWVECLNYDYEDSHSYLDDFRTQSGHYLGGQQCKGVTVRALANKGVYKTLVASFVADNDGDELANDLIDPATDGGNGLCYGCYHLFSNTLDQFEDDSYPTTGILEACTEDEYSDGCLKSTLVQDALAEFKKCSGGFPMLNQGPACTQADIDEVQTLIPAPYFTLAHCAFNPNMTYCTTINSYIARIQEDSDSNCVVCYEEFYVTALAHAADTVNTDAIDACTTDEDVWSIDCKAAMAEALANFKACAGFQLSTVKSTPPPAPTVTEAPTEAPVDTTEGPVVTTKSVAAGVASTALAVVLVSAAL